jgi:predicted MFS family arabinose efflux permease
LSTAGTGRAILLLGIASFAASASLRATDPVLARLAVEFNTTPGRAAATTTAFFLAYGLLQFVHGPLGDRYGKLRVVTIQAGLAAAATLLCALAPTLDALTAARFICGLFVGAVIPLSLAWVGDNVAYERRQAVLARVLVGSQFGVAFGLAAGGLFAEHLTWRWLFVAISTIFAAATVLLALELRANPFLRGAPADPGRKRKNGFMLLREPWVRAIIVTVFFEAMLLFGALGFIPLHLHRTLGTDLAQSGLLVSLSAVGGLGYAMSASRLVPQFGERGLVRGGGIGLAIALLMLIVVPHAAVAIVAMLLLGFSLFALHGTIQVHATQMAPDARGAAVSTFAFFLFAGQAIGTWLGSLAVDRFGTAPILGISAVGVTVLWIAFRAMLTRRAGSA